MLLPRRTLDVLERHLAGARGTVVNGARQCGKTKLLRAARSELGGTYSSPCSSARSRHFRH